MLVKIMSEEQQRTKLNSILSEYIVNKAEFDHYKKVCDRENGQIKDLMRELELPEVQIDNWIAKRIVSNKESMNMEQLLELIHKSDLPDSVKDRVIQVQEYVDMDRLEDAIYTGLIPAEFLLEMDTCRETKEIVSLKLSKVKKKKEEDE